MPDPTPVRTDHAIWCCVEHPGTRCDQQCPACAAPLDIDNEVCACGYDARRDPTPATGGGMTPDARRPFRDLCTEADYRDSLTDQEFWAHVYPDVLPPEWDTEPSLIDQEDIVNLSHLANPCPECGQSGACAYDQEGRALIHVEAGSES